MVGAHFQLHGLDGAILIANDPETAFEVVLRTEFLGIFEGLLRQLGFQNAVQRIDSDFVFIDAVSHHVPPLPEQFHAIRCHGKGVFAFAPKAFIGDFQQSVFLHRFHDRGEEVLARRDAFQQDAVAERLVFQQRVVDRHGAEQPALQAVILKHLAVLDVIAVAIALVAHNDEAKHLFHRVLPGVERAARNLFAFTQFGFRPLAVDFLQGDFLGVVERFYEPDVFVDLVFGNLF